MERLAELSWTRAESLARDARTIVLLPLGSTEAHGPHLPLATDVILSDELARRAATALEANGARSVVIAPSLAYAVTEYAAPFAGTISIAAATATALYADVCLGLQRQGFARVCLVNSHLEPAHVETVKAAVARVVEQGGRPVAFPDQLERRFAVTLGEEYRRAECHAGRYETSLVLAARRELVDDVRHTLERVPINLAKKMKEGAKDFVEAGATRAYFGDPAQATVEEGDQLYDRLVEMIVTVVHEAWP